jgi:broad specificity phosphatase PhoE
MRVQKWPDTLMMVRHGESAYNAKKKLKIPGLKEFKAKFDKEFAKMDALAVYTGKFPSRELKKMALDLLPKVAPTYSDFDTELTENGYRQAVDTGFHLPGRIRLPDEISVSPYKRTRQTLDGLREGWPELKKVKVYEDDRIREQEHGKRSVIGDPRIYFTLHPDQALNYKYATGYEFRHEGGESLLDVKARVRSKIETEIRENGGLNRKGQVVVPRSSLWVTHHRVILATRANLERWDREKFIEADNTDPPVNCGVTIYRGEEAKAGADPRDLGRLVLDKYNLKLYHD